MVNQAPVEPAGQPVGAQCRLFMAALVGIMAALAACWFAYDSHTKASKAYLIERNFRFLSAQGRALGAAIANYENIFQSILEGKPPERKPNESESSGKTRCAPSRETQELRRLCVAPHVKRIIVSESKKRQGELTVQFAKHEARLDYTTDVGCTKENDPTICNIHAEIDITKIMEDLPMEELFSDVFLADKDGHVVYQRRSRQDASDLQFADLGILLAKQQAKVEYDKALPIMEIASVGGTNFRVFAQAGLISFRHQPAGTQQGIDFILAGIVPSEKFDAEASSIPSHLLLIAIGMILAAFLTLPYLKLKALQPNESMTLTDALTLMFSSLMWIGFLTFSLLLLVAHQHSRALFDHMLERSASAISKHFAEDLTDARRQLSALDSLCESNPTCHATIEKPADKLVKNSGFVRFEISLKNGPPALELEEIGEPKKAPLVSYDIYKMFWVGRDGTKLADWGRQRAWQKVPLGERDYVKRIFDGSGLPLSRSHAADEQYWIQPSYSWTDGKNSVVVSGPSRIRPEGTLSAVAALELVMPSVMDPVVQPGFGFAVLNDQGKVLFHSDSKRNLREDFFAETDQNEELRSHILAGTPHFSDGQYWGKDRRFFTLPLRDTAGWSLVVYRDSAILDDAELRALFAGLFLFLLYSALILGVGLFGFVIYPELKQRHGGWLQPRPEHAAAYRRILFLNVALLILFGVVQGQPYLESNYPNWHQLFLLSPFALPLVMALTVYALVAFHVDHQSSKDQPRWRRDYTMMAVSCLLLFAMAPAYGCFKFAWNGEMNLYALFTQFDFKKDMHQRDQAVKTFYHGVTFRQETFRRETAGEQFVQARLANYRRDVYEEFLLHPRLDAQAGLSEKILALLRMALNERLSSETGGLLDLEGYNRSWLLGDGVKVQSLKEPPGIPGWLYWALSLGALLVLRVRYAATRAAGKRDQLAPVAVSILLLTVLVGFTIWPNPSVFLGVAAVGLFVLVLYALPRIINEGLRALHQPAIDGREPAEAEQEPMLEPRPSAAVSSLGHILWPVKIGLVALVGFIIFTQEEYRPIALAALATILPEISKLLPELHKILGSLNKTRIGVG